jgi:S1-C subfamily serine protease
MTRTPEPAPLLATPRSKIRLALVCAAILALGALSAPQSTERPLPTAEDRAAPLLEARVETREVVRPFRGVEGVAASVVRYGVTIPAVRPPVPHTRADFSDDVRQPPVDGFGVRVSSEHVVTHAAALGGRSTVALTTADGSVVDARVAAFEPASDLVLLHTPPAEGPGIAVSAQPPDPGALAVAVGRLASQDLAVPVFVTGVAGGRYHLSGDATLRPGMPVVTLDGELFAIVGEPTTTAFAARDATDRLRSMAARGDRWGAAGLVFQPLDARLSPALGETGALISEVIDGAPGSVAGLLPGDVVTGIGTLEIASADAAAAALRSATPGTPIGLRIRRQRRPRAMELAPITAYEVAALVRWTPRPSLHEARALLTAEQIASGAIPSSAEIVSIAGQPVTSRGRTQELLRRARAPALVLLRHDRRQFFAVIDAAR